MYQICCARVVIVLYVMIRHPRYHLNFSCLRCEIKWCVVFCVVLNHVFVYCVKYVVCLPCCSYIELTISIWFLSQNQAHTHTHVRPACMHACAHAHTHTHTPAPPPPPAPPLPHCMQAPWCKSCDSAFIQGLILVFVVTGTPCCDGQIPGAHGQPAAAQWYVTFTLSCLWLWFFSSIFLEQGASCTAYAGILALCTLTLGSFQH